MKFGFGPMSTEVIEAIYQYSSEHSNELMLIASKNQIDYDGGYVNDWDTETYVEHLNKQKQRYPNNKVLICRDHCGPGFKKDDCDSLRDTLHTIREDVELGFDLIHIDLCHYQGDIIQKTCECLEYARKIYPDIEFEIGTDEINRSFDEDKISEEINVFSEFDPLYYVINTGSEVKENEQIGGFNVMRCKVARHILDPYNIQIKEHNADYLCAPWIKIRAGTFNMQLYRQYVDAMNIAPQLGVVQTTTVLAEAQKHGIKVDDFVNLVYNNGKWRKWDNGNLEGNPYLAAIVAGHYHFTSDEYRKIIDEFDSTYRKSWAIIDSIILNIKDVIHHYVSSTM